jgi:hypothetical protein
MATTTATVSISSSDLTGDSLALTTTTTLTKAASPTVGLEQTTGVARKYYASAGANTLLSAAEYATATQATKVYIKNLSGTKTDTVLVTVDGGAGTDLDLGKLYGGDWTFFPWDGANDINITTSAAGMTVEYLVIFE